jgi:hypothetical protein
MHAPAAIHAAIFTTACPIADSFNKSKSFRIAAATTIAPQLAMMPTKLSLYIQGLPAKIVRSPMPKRMGCFDGA